MKIGMFESFVTSHWFSSEAKRIWSDVATLQTWLTVEAALARAQAELGIIPVQAAGIIESKSDARLFNLERLSRDIAFAQHPLVPVLHQFEELCGEPTAGFIHWGATTQNIFDTANSLQMRDTHWLLVAHLDTTIASFGRLALKHKTTVMPGRTHGQHALPMTFGFKLAGWIDELARHRDRLTQRMTSSFVTCFGGAIGTYAAMGSAGRAVEARVAEILGLQPAVVSMRSSYDRVCDYLTVLGMLAATAQKIAQDVVFMQRTEIGEVSEAFHMGKVGSSTMAQKRNPSTALLLISLARMVQSRVPAALESMVRMDEGDSSATNVTDTLLPELAIIATSVTETLDTLAQGLDVYPETMKRNLDLTNGLIVSEAVMMRLTSMMGRHEAHKLLYEAAQRTLSEHIPFFESITSHPLFAGSGCPQDLRNSLDASAYIGESAAIAMETVQRTIRNR
jgi:adenylosuccinate lyase/3-carboxy-cis,cis-muconate cycloisomerase